MTDDVAKLETRVAVLETKMEALEDLRVDLKALVKDIHDIKETIATGKGAWWAAAGLLGLLSAAGGVIGAFVHKSISAAPFPPP